MTLAIDSFRGPYRFLSNFYPCTVEVEGIKFHCSEQAYMYHKCIDQEDRDLILSARTAAEAKKFGHKVRLQPLWDDVKDTVMLEILRCKFSQNKSLGQMLMDTAPKLLIEGNTWGG